MRRLSVALLTLAIFVAPFQQAQAQLAVFDAGAYANAINQITKTVLITQQQAQQIQLLLSTYNTAAQNSRLNFGQLWPNVQQELQRLNTISTVGPTISVQAGNILQQFQSAYPRFVPNQPYTDLYALYRQSQANGVLGALQVAQAQNQEFAGETLSINALANATPQGQLDALQTGNEIAAQVVAQMQKLRALLAAQIQSEANFYSAQAAAQHLRDTDPGTTTLRTVLGTAPNALLTNPAVPPTPAPTP